MQKLDMQSFDQLNNNIEQLAKLFPQVITEKEDENGQTVKAIDFDLFKQLFSQELIEGSEERYRLDWPGKKASMLKANTPIKKTLRPVREDSVNFDSTENLYIEGDNFEVLKILQESYLGKVKMIYIDPPYNTGKDFVYKDNFKQSKDEYEAELEIIDEDGGKLIKNTDTNGRFHSDWLSMMYERLIVARDLLKDDGVIFMSIDDNEVHNLRKIADEVFGEENFVAEFIWHKKLTGGYDNIWVNLQHEYILLYSKNKSVFNIGKIKKDSKYTLFDEKGKQYKWDSLWTSSLTYSKSLDYDIEAPDGTMISPIGIKGKAFWLWSKEKVNKEKHLLKFQKDKNGEWKVYKRVYASEDGIIPESILDKELVKGNTHSAKEMKDIFGDRYFDYSKPTDLIKFFIERGNLDKHDLILDFFSGSGTTAHAVMQLNAEDGGNRKFICVQIPEKTDENSEAFKAGYKNICEIGKERIRRAGKKILEEMKKNNDSETSSEGQNSKLDTGFRVYRVDTSNMKDVFYHPSQITQNTLFDLESNIKDDRTSEDLLTQVMLDLGLTLDLPIEIKTICGNTVYLVAGNSLLACFEELKNFEIVDEMAKYNPLKIVLRDSSFKTDQDGINFQTRLKKLSPESDLRVL